NIYADGTAGENRVTAVNRALAEISGPIISSTITPVVVFLPLTLLTGVTGVFFRSLALTMAVALLTSLVLALFFTPVLAQRFVSSAKIKHSDDGLKPVLHLYERTLEISLRHSRLVLLGIAALLLLSYGMYRLLGSEFLPEFDEGGFILDYVAPPGASLAETNRMLLHVERLLKETPDVESFSRRTGLQLGLAGVTEPNTGDFAVKMKTSRNRATATVIDDVRGEIEHSQPALDTEFMGILADMIGDLASAPEPIEIKLFSDDTAALHAKAAETEEAIKKINGIVDTKSGVVVSGPALTFRIEPRLAAGFGVTATDISTAVESAMNGTKVSNILQ